jgi:hypothetical protein
MLSLKSSRILAVASIGGGIFLTIISGFYSIKPLLMDAEEIYFGFPLSWLEAFRGGLLRLGSWHYYFLWQGFFIDFFFYGLLTAAVTYLCFRFLMNK